MLYIVVYSSSNESMRNEIPMKILPMSRSFGHLSLQNHTDVANRPSHTRTSACLVGSPGRVCELPLSKSEVPSIHDDMMCPAETPHFTHLFSICLRIAKHPWGYWTRSLYVPSTWLCPSSFSGLISWTRIFHRFHVGLSSCPWMNAYRAMWLIEVFFYKMFFAYQTSLIDRRRPKTNPKRNLNTRPTPTGDDTNFFQFWKWVTSWKTTRCKQPVSVGFEWSRWFCTFLYSSCSGSEGIVKYSAKSCAIQCFQQVCLFMFLCVLNGGFVAKPPNKSAHLSSAIIVIPATH